MTETWSTTRGVTLLGKTPARADFVRINHGSPSALALDEWLQNNLEELVLGGQRNAPSARFLFCPSDANEVLVGLMAPSRDKAGRSFPVTLFSALPSALARSRPAVVAAATQPFCDSARVIFDALGELDFDALKERVASTEAPEPEAYEAAQTEVERELQAETPEAWCERLFGGSNDGMAGNALAAVIAARDKAAKGAVLECPVDKQVDALFWLSLAGRGARAPVSYFWTETPDPKASVPRTRLLLCAAAPPAQLLLHLAAPKQKPGRLQCVADPTSQSLAENAAAGRNQLEKLLAAKSLGEYLAGGA